MLDLREVFGLDVFDPAIAERPWRWLRAHIIGLLDKGDVRLSNLVREATQL